MAQKTTLLGILTFSHNSSKTYTEEDSDGDLFGEEDFDSFVDLAD